MHKLDKVGQGGGGGMAGGRGTDDVQQWLDADTNLSKVGLL